MPKATHYCIAAGCRNNNKNSDHSFFMLPSGQSENEKERCQKWLTLLGREDILEKKDLKKTSYKVCSAHFDISSIITHTVRSLKGNAIPTLQLANQPHEGPSTSTAEHISTQFGGAGILLPKSEEKGTSVSKISSNITQTKRTDEVEVISNKMIIKTEAETSEPEAVDKATQTSILRTAETQRKRKLLDEVQQYKSKQRS